MNTHWDDRLFATTEERTPQDNERWWRSCYFPPVAEVTFRGVERAVIAYGVPGSGKTTLLQAFERAENGQYLFVHYPPSYWPGEVHAWITGYGHLGQIMARATLAVKAHLSQHPEKINNLSNINQEFLRWLIEKYNGRRAILRWADAMGFAPLLELLKQPFADIYPTVTHLPDIQGQIEELITLSRRLGFAKGVAVLIDVHHSDINNKAQQEKLTKLFSWLTPLHFTGFVMKVVMPDSIVRQTNLINVTRRRVTFVPIKWSDEHCRQLEFRYIQSASDGQLKNLTDMATDDLITQLKTTLLPYNGGFTPQSSLNLIQILWQQYVKTDALLDITHYEILLRTYFSRYIPLAIDTVHKGAWLGQKFIALDERPYAILETLWRFKESDDDAYYALMGIAGKAGNLNTLVSRLRHQIEPLPRNPIYIRNTRNRGYWLENYAELPH